MGSLTIGGIVFACTFGGALVGMVLRAILPEHHVSTESKDVVKLGMGLIATLAALVLGLLIASAKSSFDAQRSGFQQLAANLVLLDRALARYGPETKDAREALRSLVAATIDRLWPEDASKSSGLGSCIADGHRRTAHRSNPRSLAQERGTALGPVPSPADHDRPCQKSLAVDRAKRERHPDGVSGCRRLLVDRALHEFRPVQSREPDRHRHSFCLRAVGGRRHVPDRRLGRALWWADPTFEYTASQRTFANWSITSLRYGIPKSSRETPRKRSRGSRVRAFPARSFGVFASGEKKW